MKLRWGATRIVFVFPTQVVKIPRVRLLLALFRFIKKLLRHELAARLNEIEKPLALVLRTYVTAGLHANRKEYQYFKDHPDSVAIMPVRLLARGLIEIQKRGDELSEGDHKWDKLCQVFKINNFDEQSDLLKARNFCRSDDRIRIVDFGNPYTIAALDYGGLKLIEMH